MSSGNYFKWQTKEKTQALGIINKKHFLDRQLETKKMLLPGQVKRKDGSWVGERQVVVSLWE